MSTEYRYHFRVVEGKTDDDTMDSLLSALTRQMPGTGPVLSVIDGTDLEITCSIDAPDAAAGVEAVAHQVRQCVWAELGSGARVERLEGSVAD